MADRLAFAIVFATIITTVAFLEYRYKRRIERRRGRRLAIARAHDRMRGTAEENQILRETRLQHAIERSMCYVISVSMLCVGLLLVRAGLLPP